MAFTRNQAPATADAGTSSSPLTATFGANALSGDLIAVFVNSHGDATCTVTVKDNLGNSLAQIGTYQVVGTQVGSLWWLQTATGTVNAVTATPSVAVALSVAAHDYTPPAGTTVSVHAGSGTTVGPTNTPTSPSVATSAGDMVLAAMANGSAAVASVASPFTMQVSDAAGFDWVNSAHDLAPSGSEAATFTISASQNATCPIFAASFSATGGGGGGTDAPIASMFPIFKRRRSPLRRM